MQRRHAAKPWTRRKPEWARMAEWGPPPRAGSCCCCRRCMRRQLGATVALAGKGRLAPQQRWWWWWWWWHVAANTLLSVTCPCMRCGRARYAVPRTPPWTKQRMPLPRTEHEHGAASDIDMAAAPPSHTGPGHGADAAPSTPTCCMRVGTDGLHMVLPLVGTAGPARLRRRVSKVGTCYCRGDGRTGCLPPFPRLLSPPHPDPRHAKAKAPASIQPPPRPPCALRPSLQTDYSLP